MPRVEIAAGDVSVVVDAPRVALTIVHRLALEGLTAAMLEASRAPKPARVGFVLGCETELVDPGELTPPTDAQLTGSHQP